MYSIKQLLNTISLFSSFSGLKPNLSKRKVAGIRLLKGVKVAVCEIKCIDLTKDVIKMLGFFLIKNSELEQNFKKTIIGIKKFLRLWQRRNLTLEGKTIIFKTYIFSSSFTDSYLNYYHYTENAKRNFNAKIKHETT